MIRPVVAKPGEVLERLRDKLLAAWVLAEDHLEAIEVGVAGDPSAMNSDGVEIQGNWDTLGMRGTGSCHRCSM